MLSNNLTKDEICESIEELIEYRSFYEKKVQTDREVIAKIDTLVEKDLKRSKEYLTNMLDKLQDNLDSYEENILLLDENIDLLEDIQKYVKEKTTLLEVSKDSFDENNQVKINIEFEGYSDCNFVFNNNNINSKNTFTIESQNNQELSNELKEKIEKYNSQYTIIKTNYNEYVFSENNIMMDYLEAQGQETENNEENNLEEEDTTTEDIEEDNDIENDEESIEEILSDKKKNNDILLISEIQNKVILPYKIEELIQILKSDENEYKTLQEIIDEEFTIPLVNYKHARISRFKEAFSLMKRKEDSSFMDAIDLAFELMGNRFLHPAIITACKNLDQLDVYLDCLDTNELEEFPFFEIKYELYPIKAKIKFKFKRDEFEFDDTF